MISDLKKYLNTHKCEDKKDFKTSIFSEVYLEVCVMVKEIIEANQRFDKNNLLEQFCNENYISNTISFLGERGMGKSSAMLSFSYFLKIYDIQDLKQDDLYRISDCKFYVLPKIDATMMSKEENLLDILLAKMWDTFYKKLNEQSLSGQSYNITQEKFEKTKQVYSSYWKEEKASRRIQKYSSLEELHELSQSINLRKCITELIESYLHFMMDNRDNTYLVITVDDLDLVQENVYDKIDYIRLFLTIPKVIILVTADINRLEMNLSTLFSKQFLCEYNIKESEKDYVRTYADEYLKKVFPRNMRIYMPYDDQQIVKKFINENMNFFVQIYDNNKLQKIYNDADLQITENMLISSLIAKSTNILLFSNLYSYSVKSKNLRDLVNGLYELIQVDFENNNIELIYQWMLKELLISINNIRDGFFLSYVNEIKRISEEELNEYLITLNKKIYRELIQEDYSFEEDYSNIINILGHYTGYGAVLYTIFLVENKTILDPEITRQIIWIYSIAISRSINLKKRNKLENLLQREIFSTIVFSNFYFVKNFLSFIKTIQTSIELKKNDYLLHTFLNKYKKTFIKLFWKLFILDMSEIDKKIESATIKITNIEKGKSVDLNEDEKLQDDINKVYILEIKNENEFLIDNLFYNILNLEEYWNKYFESLCKKMNNGMQEKKKKGLKQGIEKELGIDLTIYHKWKEKYNIKNIQDLIPVQDVGVMLEVLKQLKGFSINKDTMICDYFKIIIDIMQKTFAKAERYCQVDILKGGFKKSSVILLELSEILKDLYKVFDWKFGDYFANFIEEDSTV